MEGSRKTIKNIMEEVTTEVCSDEVIVGVSNRHIHITREDLDILYGKGYELKPFKDLKQPGHYAAKEKLDIKGGKGSIKGIRILGPLRKYTQVEIAMSDTYKLGVKPVIRSSGDIADTPGIELIGPQGRLTLKNGVIVARRHIHMPGYIACAKGYKDSDQVDIEISGERRTIFCNVGIRVGENVVQELHLDIDEANAAGIKNGDCVRVVRK